VQAVVRTTNVSKRDAWLWPGECDQSGTRVTADLRQVVSNGESQAGNAEAFKSLVTSASHAFREEFVAWAGGEPATAWGAVALAECTIQPKPHRLASGQSREERFLWYPATALTTAHAALALPPGEVSVGVSVPVLRPRAEVPASIDSRRARRARRTVEVAGPIQVPGSSSTSPTIPGLVDQALLDPGFRTWVDADSDRDTWRGVEVFAWSADAPPEDGQFADIDAGARPFLVTMTLVLWDAGRSSARDGSILLDGLTGEVVATDVGQPPATVETPSVLASPSTTPAGS